MRRILASFGFGLSALALMSALGSTAHVSAAGSTSYTLHSNFGNEAAEGGGVSTNYALQDASHTWNEKPAKSNNYVLTNVTENTTASSSSAGGTAGGTGGTSGGEGGSGGGGTRSSSSSSSSSSTSSLSSSIASSQGTSSSASPTATGTIDGDRDPFSETADSVDVSDYTVVASNVTRVLTYQFFDAVDDKPCTQDFVVLRGSAPVSPWAGSYWILLLVLLVLGGGWMHDTMRHRAAHRRAEREAKKKKNSTKKVLSIFIALALLTNLIPLPENAFAVSTVPNKNMYNGRLLDASGNVVTASTSIRFSYWNSADFVTGDVDGAGAINTGATTYIGWNEVHTVTPDSSGRFSVELGSITTLPNFATLSIANMLSLYLQVEVKPAASANTAYELLDTDPTDTAVDRSGVLSVPFAENANLLDQREIGTASGSIALLGSGGIFTPSVAPSGTNTSSFVVDADNTEASQIVLQFGTTLAKKLTYDITRVLFSFNASLEVQGNLTVTGLINGVDITNIAGSADALKALSGGGLNLNVTAGSYRLNGNITNYAGSSIALTSAAINYVYFDSTGLIANTSGFPTDKSFIPVAEVTTTIGSVGTIADRRALSTNDRESTVSIVMNPAFEKASYQGDGANNVGQLSVSFDNTNKKNFYVWTSTKTSLQDYDIFIKVPLSPAFARWLAGSSGNPIELTYRSTSASAADNALDMVVYDTNGTPVSLSGSTTGLANTSWTTSPVEFTGSPTWTAGQDMLIKLTVSAKDDKQMQIGGLKLQYTELR